MFLKNIRTSWMARKSKRPRIRAQTLLDKAFAEDSPLVPAAHLCFVVDLAPRATKPDLPLLARVESSSRQE